MTTAASVELERWFAHTLSIKRITGRSAAGRTFADPVDVVGFYSDETMISGGEIVANGRFAFGRDVAYIPVDSSVVLPAEFGGRTVTVVFSEVGDGAGRDVPEHQVIGVK